MSDLEPQALPFSLPLPSLPLPLLLPRPRQSPLDQSARHHPHTLRVVRPEHGRHSRHSLLAALSSQLLLSLDVLSDLVEKNVETEVVAVVGLGLGLPDGWREVRRVGVGGDPAGGLEAVVGPADELDAERVIVFTGVDQRFLQVGGVSEDRVVKEADGSALGRVAAVCDPQARLTVGGRPGMSRTGAVARRGRCPSSPRRRAPPSQTC